MKFTLDSIRNHSFGVRLKPGYGNKTEFTLTMAEVSLESLYYEVVTAPWGDAFRFANCALPSVKDEPPKTNQLTRIF